MKFVIRAGGSGTRLWPLSRQSNPKQFQAVIGDESMIRTTYARIAPAAGSPDDIFVSINKTHCTILKDELPEVPGSNVIVETDKKNTGPAMCLEVCYLERNSDPKTVIASLPSDDFISDSAAFRDLLKLSEDFIHEHPDYIVTPAVKPSFPDTGYTYFKVGKNLQPAGEEAVYTIADVVEKPSIDHLQELIDSGVYFSHTGMYIWQLGTIARIFRQLQPRMYAACTDVAALMHTDSESPQIQELYSQLEAMSIESAVTDQYKKLAMSVSNRIGWSDLGKWHAVKKAMQKEESDTISRGNVQTREADGNLIFSTVDKKIIVANDVNDLAIIDTKDALFISSLKNSADVKKIVEELKRKGKDLYV